MSIVKGSSENDSKYSEFTRFSEKLAISTHRLYRTLTHRKSDLIYLMNHFHNCPQSCSMLGVLQMLYSRR